MTDRRAVWSWALYDWANSAFATTVIAAFFPVFFKQYWSGQVPATTSTLQLGVGSSVASLVVMILAPILGAIADRNGGKKAFLAAFTGLGVTATAALFWVGQGQWLTAIGLFTVASVGFFGGLTFYDGLLTDVAAPQSLDRVSAFGYALGYLGGGVLLALNVAMTEKPGWFGLSGPAAGIRWSLLSVAVWWAVFTLPLLCRVRETRPAAPVTGRRAITAGLAELWRTVGHIRAVQGAAVFLIAYWLYIDGVNTIYRMAVDFGLSLGFASSNLIVALLLVQFVSFPAALAFGWLGERWGPRRAIYLGLAVYAAVTGWGYFMTTVTQFYVLAAVIGLVQGGVQSLSRSFFARFAPAGKAGEFFGFYNMVGKFSAVLGPALVGVTAVVTSSARLSILAVLILFAAGGVLLTLVPRPASIEGVAAKDMSANARK